MSDSSVLKATSTNKCLKDTNDAKACSGPGFATTFPSEYVVKIPLSAKIVEKNKWLGVNYQIADGDNLRKIAQEFYSDESKWVVIYALNFAIIGKDPKVIQKRTTIFIPIQQKSASRKPIPIDIFELANTLKGKLNNAEDKAGVALAILEDLPEKFKLYFPDFDIDSLRKSAGKIGSELDRVDFLITSMAMLYCKRLRNILFDIINGQLRIAHNHVVSILSISLSYSALNREEVLAKLIALHKSSYSLIKKESNVSKTTVSKVVKEMYVNNPLKLKQSAQYKSLQNHSDVFFNALYACNRFVYGQPGLPNVKYNLNDISTQYAKHLFSAQNTMVGFLGDIKVLPESLKFWAKLTNFIGDSLSALGYIDSLFDSLPLVYPSDDEVITGIFKSTEQSSVYFVSPWWADFERYVPKK